MSNTRTTPRPRSTNSLPRYDEPRRGGLLGFLALIGSALLLIGVPVLLVRFVGNPLPTTAPSRDWINAPLTPQLLINVLAVLLWIVWVHFVVCFLTEWRAVRRGAMPGRVIMGGGSQVLARQLVAGILLLAGGASAVQGVASMAFADQAGAVQHTVSTVSGDQVAPAADQSAAQPMTKSAAKKFTTVKPVDGRHHDTLWDIAERTLGDPLRYKEIYELNSDRVMPDGRTFSDADLIQPGWQLFLPGDASGDGVETVAAHSVPGALGEGAAQGAKLGSGGAGSGVERSDTEQQGGPVTTDVIENSAGVIDSNRDAQLGLGELLLGGSLILAGVGTALSARRGPFGNPTEEEGRIRLAGNGVRADFLDRALRLLSATRAGQNLPLPDVSIVYASDDQIILHVVGDQAPPTHPWRSSADGKSWMIRAADLGDAVIDAPTPYPALVNIAESYGFDVLIDLEYASGLVAVGGSPAISREIVQSFVLDLATHSWSDGVEITMVGFGDDLSQMAPQRIRSTTDFHAAMSDIEGQLGEASRLLGKLGVDGVLSGRAAMRHSSLAPRVLVLSAPPTPDELQRIRALSASGRTSFAAVCVGDIPGARWRFAAEPTGNIDLGVLGVNGTARRLTLDAAGQLRGWLRLMDTDRQEMCREVPNISAAMAAPAANAGPTGAFDRAAGAAVRLLGPVQVEVAGGFAPRDADLLTELVVMAALHPDGLHEAVIASGLWPRGVGDDVVGSTLREAQTWLGVDASGVPRLARGSDGLWRLSADVYVDWAEFRAISSAAPAATLMYGLSLVRGEAFSHPQAAGRYTWLAFHRAAREARLLVTGVAARASAQLLALGNRASAEDALRRGLTLVPESELLWRDLIKMYQGNPGGAGGVIDELLARFGEQRLEPETDALIAHVRPGSARIGS